MNKRSLWGDGVLDRIASSVEVADCNQLNTNFGKELVSGGNLWWPSDNIRMQKAFPSLFHMGYCRNHRLIRRTKYQMQRWRLFSPMRIARLAHTAKKVSHFQRQIWHFDDVRCVIAAAKHVSMLTLASSSKCIKPNVSNKVTSCIKNPHEEMLLHDIQLRLLNNCGTVGKKSPTKLPCPFFMPHFVLNTLFPANHAARYVIS